MVSDHTLAHRSMGRTLTGREGTSLQHVAQGVHMLQVGIVNVFFLIDPRSGQWVLVDAGMPRSGGRIRSAAETLFGEDARPEAIILTHAHFDHTGALRELADGWDVPVYAHRMELPFLTGRSKYPPPDPTVGGMMARSSILFPRGPLDVSDRVLPLPEDGSVPGAPDWRWVHTPGHTPGHVSLFREQDRTLIAGDAFVTTRQESAVSVLTQRREIHGPPAYFTPDWASAARSVHLLLDMRPEAVGAGHGLPMHGREMRRALAELAEHFTDLAVPRHGRYVGRPAAFDEDGTLTVPPPVNDILPKALIALGLLFMGVGVSMAAANRRR